MQTHSVKAMLHRDKVRLLNTVVSTSCSRRWEDLSSRQLAISQLLEVRLKANMGSHSKSMALSNTLGMPVKDTLRAHTLRVACSTSSVSRPDRSARASKPILMYEQIK